MNINKKTLTVGFIASVVSTIIIAVVGDAINMGELIYLSFIALASFGYYALFTQKGWFK